MDIGNSSWHKFPRNVNIIIRRVVFHIFIWAAEGHELDSLSTEISHTRSLRQIVQCKTPIVRWYSYTFQRKEKLISSIGELLSICSASIRCLVPRNGCSTRQKSVGLVKTMIYLAWVLIIGIWIGYHPCKHPTLGLSNKSFSSSLNGCAMPIQVFPTPQNLYSVL